jgi:hypothetical protein
VDGWLLYRRWPESRCARTTREPCRTASRNPTTETPPAAFARPALDLEGSAPARKPPPPVCEVCRWRSTSPPRARRSSRRDNTRLPGRGQSLPFCKQRPLGDCSSTFARFARPKVKVARLSWLVVRSCEAYSRPHAALARRSLGMRLRYGPTKSINEGHARLISGGQSLPSIDSRPGSRRWKPLRGPQVLCQKIRPTGESLGYRGAGAAVP